MPCPYPGIPCLFIRADFKPAPTVVDGISEVAFMTMMRRDYYAEPQSVVIKPVFFHDTIDGFPVYSSLAGSLGNIAP